MSNRTGTAASLLGALLVAWVAVACGQETEVTVRAPSTTAATTPPPTRAPTTVAPTTTAVPVTAPTTTEPPSVLESLPDWATTPGPIWPEPGFVALTFDDGPDPVFTQPILEVLAEHDVPATFFVVGRSAVTWPELVQAMVDGGHAVGNHTWDHPDLTTLPDGAISDQILRTSEAVVAAVGVSPRCLRPPAGASDERVEAIALALGMDQVLWNIDPRDYLNPPPDEMAREVIENALDHPTGRIVIGLHDAGPDRTSTVEALPLIITGLRDAGFEFTRLC